MSEQNDEDRALDQGRACAMTALLVQRDFVASLAPQERLFWWLGFLTAAMGAAVASLGERTARALRGALSETREPWLRPMTHVRRTYIRRSKK
ncbi:MAG TPA: hypothetical protein VMG11_14395 [Steroidobacteraceae bacterium]|nr:hypothetical protein [Steroidobacteraceae bacterium]